MVDALAERGIGGADAGPALIIGAGATACAALGALAQLGRKVGHRGRPRPGQRPLTCARAADRLGIAVTLAPVDTVGTAKARAWSSQPCRRAPPIFWLKNSRPASSHHQVVLDVVYHPWPTPLAVAAAAAGAVLVSGFDLLLHQAAGQVELMTDRPAPLEAMRQAWSRDQAPRRPERSVIAQRRVSGAPLGGLWHKGGFLAL